MAYIKRSRARLNIANGIIASVGRTAYEGGEVFGFFVRDEHHKSAKASYVGVHLTREEATDLCARLARYLTHDWTAERHTMKTASRALVQLAYEFDKANEEKGA